MRTGRAVRSIPKRNKLYVFSVTAPSALGLVPADPAKSDFGYALGVARANAPATRRDRAGRGGGGAAARRRGGWRRTRRGCGRGGGREGGGALSVQGLPLIKPPYGRITAIDLNKGDIIWQVAHGETPDNIKNHPALKGLDDSADRAAGTLGVLVTKNLVIAGEGGFVTAARTVSGARCCAPTTRPRARKSGRCSCRRRKRARR